MHRSSTALTALTGVATAAFLLAGCGSSTDGSAQPASSSSGSTTQTQAAGTTDAASSTQAPVTTAAAASQDFTGLALGAGDFPPPYMFTELPAGAREQAAQAAGGARGAEVDPPECGNATLSNSQADVAKAGLALATDKASGATIVETVTAAQVPVAQSKQIVAKCPAFSLKLPSLGGATAQATLTELDAPSVPGADTLAVRVVEKVDTGGTTVNVDATTVVAQLDGVQVTVVGTAPPGATIEPALLNQLLTAGVAKVRNGR